MEFQMPAGDILPFGLRAMKTVALANGRFEETERELLIAARDVLGSSENIDGLTLIKPGELASAVVDPQLRKQLIAGLVVMAMIDGEATSAEVVAIEAFSSALEVEFSYLHTLRKLASGHLTAVRFDLFRHAWPRKHMSEAVEKYGWRWVGRTAAAFLGIREDRTLANRHRALQDLSPSTLGGAYVAFMRSNRFAFPGEKGGGPEFVLYHDLTHVLSGYGTSPEEETQVAAFHAGARRQDPFFFVFFVMLQFHLGIRITPITPGRRGKFDPHDVLAAVRRGAACRIDPTDDWDPWPVMGCPLDELREAYGISALGSETRLCVTSSSEA